MQRFSDSPIERPALTGHQTIKGKKTGKIRVMSITLLCSCLTIPWSWAQNTGITDKTLPVGSLLPLQGERSETGLALKAGLEAALASHTVQGRRVELVALSDFYEPAKTVEGAKKLIDQGIFLMIGNHGTPTVKAILPLLAENKIPLIAPYTGAALTEPGDILNFRTSYGHEVESVISLALAAGIKPVEVCGYVQNDSYGVNGLQGMRMALANQSGSAPILAKLDEMINKTGDNPDRDNIGPAGFYQRDTSGARNGYQSLKKWEQINNSHCRLVITVGVFDAISKFIEYARSKGETWAFSLVSFNGAPVKAAFKELGMTGKIIQSQVVPPLDSALVITDEARKALGQRLSHASLEGYIAGKLFLAIASAVDGPLTRESFLKAAHRQVYDLGGLKVDFTNGKNPGFNTVFLSYLNNGTAFVAAKPDEVEALLKN